jgi:squalene-hopene/tetraprenyl-beta-curcumene cyclase
MKRTISRPAPEPASERDAAWFEELADAVGRGRAGLLARVSRLRSGTPRVADAASVLACLAETGQSGDSAACEAAVRRLLEPARPLDADETAAVLVALGRSGHATRAACAATVYEGINRLLDAQDRGGGWGVPGAPGCPGVTGRVLEALGHYGFRVGQPPVAAAVKFVLAHQEESGAWVVRGDGIAASRSALAGLHAIGFDVTLPAARRAVRWLKEAQTADGGWGAADAGAAAPTACALLGLLAAGEADGPEVRAGAEFLVGTQHADGGWDDAAGCLPLAALARYANAVGDRPSGGGPIRRDAGHGAPGPTAGPRRRADR